MNRPDPRTAAAERIVADWPSDDWLTEGALAELLHDGHPVTVGRHGFVYGDLGSLKGILSHARRSGILIRNQRVQPPVYAPVVRHESKRMAVTRHA